MFFFNVIAPTLAVILSVLLAVGVFYIALNKRLQPEILLFLMIATLGAVGYFLTSRSLNIEKEILDLPDLGENSLARFANLSAVLLCFAMLIQTFLQGVVSKTSLLLLASALQYYFVCFIYPSSFDRWFRFDHTIIYPMIGLVILIAPSKLKAAELARRFIWIATIPPALSIILALVKHDAAMLDSYQSVLPFLPGRLYGATPHPNVMGSLSTFVLLLLIAFPIERRAEFWTLFSIDFSTLMLSQSKTSWITFLLGLAVLKLPSVRKFKGRVSTPIIVIAFLIIAALPAVASVTNQSLYDSWSDNENLKSIGTLTGRTDIWKIALFMVQQHPFTGPGYATFQIYMQSLYPDLVANPHNLYLATLLQAGLIGLISLSIYLVTLIATSARLDGPQRLFCIAYVLLIFVRGLSESFTIQAAFLGPNFWALIMFMRLIAVSSAERRTASIHTPNVAAKGLVARERL